jgi:hypothetical protein
LLLVVGLLGPALVLEYEGQPERSKDMDCIFNDVVIAIGFIIKALLNTFTFHA